jgi:predicted O-methyltransferase YrrM
MFEISKEIEEYILRQTGQQDDLLYELYRETHKKVLHPRMLSGRMQGRMLELISKMLMPSRILEIGTYTGYSAICLARGLASDGQIDTIEINDELEDFIRHYLNRSGLEEKINLHIGDALNIMDQLQGSYPLIFIDGDKRQYPDYLRTCKKLLAPGGTMLADNVLWDGKVLDQNTQDAHTQGIRQFNDMIREDPNLESLILPIRDGLMMARKKR